MLFSFCEKSPISINKKRSEKKVSSVLLFLLSQHVLKENLKFLEEPVNSSPHCWIISTGDATKTEPVTALITWFRFCENSLHHKREEGKEKSLKKATWSFWTGRMLFLFSAQPQMQEDLGKKRHPGTVCQRHHVPGDFSWTNSEDKLLEKKDSRT